MKQIGKCSKIILKGKRKKMTKTKKQNREQKKQIFFYSNEKNHT
jgi:hypothetical protein